MNNQATSKALANVSFTESKLKLWKIVDQSHDSKEISEALAKIINLIDNEIKIKQPKNPLLLYDLNLTFDSPEISELKSEKMIATVKLIKRMSSQHIRSNKVEINSSLEGDSGTPDNKSFKTRFCC